MVRLCEPEMVCCATADWTAQVCSAIEDRCGKIDTAVDAEGDSAASAQKMSSTRQCQSRRGIH